MIRPTKKQLEYYVNARPRTKEVPGYFDDAGNLHRGPYYAAMLGTQQVGFKTDAYDSNAGCYISRSGALEGAKLFQQKMKEWLEEEP